MAKKYLDGIDVSSNQPKDICMRVPFDFAIVKAGGNPKQKGLKWDYVNPYASRQVSDALFKTGCAGLYWFCHGLDDATREADKFVSVVKNLNLVHKVVLVADYEADALLKGPEWLDKFCKRVEEKTSTRVVIYSQGSAIDDQKLYELHRPIWCANYSLLNKKVSGYNTDGMKMRYPIAKMWQYTEHGYLPGYADRLDLNRFFGTKEDWLKLAGQTKTAEPAKPKEIRYKVTTPALRVRNKASTHSGRIKGMLYSGSMVYISNTKTNQYGNVWAKISRGTYKGCWIAIKFNDKTLAKKG